jgi:hypothetical protein
MGFPVTDCKRTCPTLVTSTTVELPERQTIEHRVFQSPRNGGAVVKQHFYIGNDDDAERCKDAFRSRKPIAVGGTDTLTGRVKSYKGVVLDIEAISVEVPGERWRITIDTER